MKYAICRNGETFSGTINVLLEKNETTLIFKDVPAAICDNCGEEYVSSEVNNTLLKKAHDAESKGVEIELLCYAT
ncbi:MAG: type II toxin-antitoxin system MqsA family antitoxin [Fibrobacter sp.]|nr:type II toxin-antitoxin system MqsA family antitoxin [Fibrobacter sp.]